MTEHNLSKLLHSFKSFLNRSKRKRIYFKALEADYIRLSTELTQLKRFVSRKDASDAELSQTPLAKVEVAA